MLRHPKDLVRFSESLTHRRPLDLGSIERNLDEMKSQVWTPRTGSNLPAVTPSKTNRYKLRGSRVDFKSKVMPTDLKPEAL